MNENNGIGALEITDPHHHIWDLEANYYPWLTDRITPRVCGDYAPIRKNYLIDDYLQDARGLNLVRSIHVQAEHDPRDPVRETRWLHEVQSGSDSNGFPHGIVAYADFGDSDVQSVLEAHCEYPTVRGIRQMLHEGLVDPTQSHASPMEDPVWRRNFKLLERYPLSFDLQVFPQQMDLAVDLVKENPNVPFVVCHTGQPVRQDSEGLALWMSGMRRLAEMPNVSVKVSGFGMFDRQWTVRSIREIVLRTIDAFGVDRCMFATNFPVDGMMKSYMEIWQAYSAVTLDFSAEERQKLFSANARRIYRV